MTSAYQMPDPVRHHPSPDPYVNSLTQGQLLKQAQAWTSVAHFLSTTKARAKSVNARASRIARSVAGAIIHDAMIYRIRRHIGDRPTAFDTFTPATVSEAVGLCLQLARECEAEAAALTHASRQFKNSPRSTPSHETRTGEAEQ